MDHLISQLNQRGFNLSEDQIYELLDSTQSTPDSFDLNILIEAAQILGFTSDKSSIAVPNSLAKSADFRRAAQEDHKFLIALSLAYREEMDRLIEKNGNPILEVRESYFQAAFLPIFP